jgi:phosphomethylpyrimidine synthase
MDLDRNDVEELTEISSEYGKKRLNDELNELRLNIYTNQCMPKGANVSQLYYAKQGIITPEMEYIAIRENQRLELINEQTKAMQCQHEGNSWVQTLLSFSGRSGWGKSHLNLSVAEVARGRAIIPNNINHPESDNDCRS